MSNIFKRRSILHWCYQEKNGQFPSPHLD